MVSESGIPFADFIIIFVLGGGALYILGRAYGYEDGRKEAAKSIRDYIEQEKIILASSKTGSQVEVNPQEVVDIARVRKSELEEI